MKDTAHHLRNVQKKIIRSVRQEKLQALSHTTPKLAMLAPEPESLKHASEVDEGRVVAAPKRAGLPKMMRAQSYH
ncbi:hypothetical protein PNK_0605 [Candidatus Protochlamydia naegleriophila]|uniref:Uncharacterized protein n=1 Tax=Candidatus Protochlamydia naegleriophila TaxID=389348 RepID=A0A0U5J824_9BACT|nr:hypothetical protein [Candidatus Protochlamydia naegleriophila]CUI16233.1 hypothetical protein PNK_0605 [Candidatus Protochlamydia naegleriophila]